MAEKSTESKRSKKSTLVFEPADFRRLFKYLPLNVFREVTNIEQLITAEYKKKHDNKLPPVIHINKTAEKHHKHMSTLDDWKGTILEQLDFNWPSKPKTHASIWSLKKNEQEKVHDDATDHQKQFIYLPLHVFVENTNAKKLMHKEAVKAKQDLDLVNKYVQGLHPHLHVVTGWRPFMKKLKFNENQTNDTEATGKDNPTESVEKSDKSKGSEPVPSTSKQADQVATKSKQANVTKRSNSVNPIPSTSKQAGPTTSTLETAEIEKSPQKTAQKKKNTNGNQARITRYMRRSPVSTSNSKQADQVATKSKQANIDKSLKSANPIPSTSKQADSTTTTPKTVEIVRSPQKTAQNKENADNNQTPTTRNLRKRQSDSNHADGKRSPKRNESASSPDTNASGKRKMVQSVRPNWMQSISPMQKASEDAGQSRLAKRPRTQLFGAIVRKQTNELPTENINMVSKSKEVVSAVVHAENDENDYNVERPTEEAASISGELTNAQKNQTSLEAIDEIIPTSGSTQTSSESRLIKQKPRELNAEDREREQLMIQPSDFQRAIQAMSYDEFLTRTNIKEIIKNAHFQGVNDIPEEDMDIKLKYYFDFRMQTSNWLRNAIRNLKYIECKCTGIPDELRLNEQQPTNSLNANQSRLPRTSSSSSLSRRNDNNEPSEFQKEVIAMDFDAFVRETNIAQLVEQDFDEQFEGKKEFTSAHLEFGLKKYDELRKVHRKWHVNSLKNLKFKVCDCRRNKTFVDKSIQTVDQPKVQDAAVQYDDEFREIEEVQALKSRLASLAIHQPTEPEIVHAQNEIESSDSSEVSSSQDASMDNDRSMQGDGTQSTSSGNVTASGQEAAPQSQQIMSVEQVKMSELMLRSPVQQTEQLNPIEVENISDEDPILSSTRVVSNEVEVEEEQETVYASQSVGNSQFRITPISQLQNTNVMVKVEELSYHLGDDSDVEYVYVPEQIIEISDLLSTQEQFIQIDGYDEMRQSSNERHSLVIVHTQTENLRASEQDDEQANEQANEVKDEIDELALGDANGAAVEDANAEANAEATQQISGKSIEEDRQELIRILEDPPTIEDSDESIHISQIGNADFQVPRNDAPPRAFASKRLQQAPAQTGAVTKKRRTSKEEDPLKNIPVPKYNYRPLDFHVRDRSEATQNQATNNRPAQIEESQSSPDTSRNYTIDESSSTDETINDGMTTDSCVERANLLNEDNTLFLDINTQPVMNSDVVSSSQINQTTITSASMVQPEQAASLSIPGPSRLSLFHDQTEFLHYIDIQSVLSSFKNVILPNGERSNQLNIETTLKHQCNGGNRIVVNGNAIKLIMKMNDKEWDALCDILSALGDYYYDARGEEPTNDTILHRAVHYLFKTAPKISTVHIAYGDQDLDTARVFNKPNHSNENVTAAIDPYVLAMMQATAQENTK
ncbi:uncharacterized protein LOC129565135 isoform X2 [Sitodiplosis mosellana]|uniref:uncharacterized protein LOC129565135 isoform X2 n=1 Tax=Sitodiplosis mosellana TaxID=263140 RepID=UPI002443A340|nr:uncharacterized protein LOC129565135 isoform X2 [Sitodiplosis mosellana]